MTRFGKQLLFLTAAALLVFSGCGESKQSATDEANLPVPVEMIPVRLGAIENTIDFFGNVVADQQVEVYSTVANRVVGLYVEVGRMVAAGDVLAEIDTEKIRQAVTQAEAGLESAQAQAQTVSAEWERIKKLYDNNAISQSQYEAVQAQRDGAQSALKQVRAALSTARSQLQDTKITAPISGVVSQRRLEVGDMAVPQVPIFTVEKMDTVRVQVNVIERYISIIRPGQPARILVASYPDSVFRGVVTRVDPTLNPLTRTAGAEIVIPNPGLLLKPGMFANVAVVIEHKENVPIIPANAVLESTYLVHDNDNVATGKVRVDRRVFVVTDDIARERPVQLGIVDRTLAEVVAGLSGGERIVSVGQHNLSDSSRIAIVTETTE